MTNELIKKEDIEKSIMTDEKWNEFLKSDYLFFADAADLTSITILNTKDCKITTVIL